MTAEALCKRIGLTGGRGCAGHTRELEPPLEPPLELPLEPPPTELELPLAETELELPLVLEPPLPETELELPLGPRAPGRCPHTERMNEILSLGIGDFIDWGRGRGYGGGMSKTLKAKLITGEAAICAHVDHGVVLHKYADPFEDARSGLTTGEALAVAREDPSLIWCHVLVWEES